MSYLADMGANLQLALAKRATFSGRARTRFYDKLFRFTRAGVRIDGALGSMHTRYLQRKDPRAMLFARIRNRMQQGDPISQALAPYIPSGERQLIQAGEASGKLFEGFREAKKLAEAGMRIRSALIGELMYPIMLLGVVLCILGVISFQLVPQLIEAVPFPQWPGFSRGLYYLSRAVADYGLWMGLAFVGGLIASLRSLPRWRGGRREWCDRWLPPWTVYREIIGSSVLIALSALTGAGVSIAKSVEQLGLTASPWLKVHFTRFARSLDAGIDSGKSLRSGLFNSDVEDDIEDYSNAIGFEEALARLGDDQVNDAITRIRERAAVMRVGMFLLVVSMLLYIYAAAGMVAISIGKSAMSGIPS
ncbi:MAG: type II secretion system F family protein [Rhodanobacteraceae bacterium]|nr:type II secretion system F family protein [Rhodanobacteraceae bacterium]